MPRKKSEKPAGAPKQQRINRTGVDDNANSRTMTIPIHGTLSASDPWYQPDSPMHNYLRALFPNDFFEMDAGEEFNWVPALPNKRARWRGAEKLFYYCKRYHESEGIQFFRLVGHSHGSTVASICTNYMQVSKPDWKVRSLVMLAPLQSRKYPADHLPNLNSVVDDCFFNLHAEFDLVVARRRRRQNFQRVEHLRDHEREFVLDCQLGHWLPTEPEKWDESRFGDAVVAGCLQIASP